MVRIKFNGIITSVTGNTVTILPNLEKLTDDEISKEGDSSALWRTDEKYFKAVALDRTGESDDARNTKYKAFAIPIKRVLSILKCNFYRIIYKR